MVGRMRADPELCEDRKSLLECHLQTYGRDAAEALIRLFHSTLVYLSGLIDGPVPVLLPREDVESLTAAPRQKGPAVTLARSIERLVRDQTTELLQPRDDQLLAKLEDLLARHGADAVPLNGRFLNTAQMAKRLGMAPKTVRKLCSQGQIKAKKLAGGEWRTTQEDLDDSPYLKRKNRRGNAPVE
jgi:excisionase family DNA binding protein